MPECSGVDLGRLFDLTERRIQQLVTAGSIIRLSRGKYDLWPSIRGYTEYLKGLAVADEKLLTKENLKLKEIQRKKLESELIDAKEMESELIKKFSAIRNRARSIGPKSAQQIYDIKIGKKKKREVLIEIENLLTIEIDDALSELALPGENREKVKPKKQIRVIKKVIKKKKAAKKVVKKKKVVRKAIKKKKAKGK